MDFLIIQFTPSAPKRLPALLSLESLLPGKTSSDRSDWFAGETLRSINLSRVYIQLYKRSLWALFCRISKINDVLSPTTLTPVRVTSTVGRRKTLCRCVCMVFARLHGPIHHEERL